MKGLSSLKAESYLVKATSSPKRNNFFLTLKLRNQLKPKNTQKKNWFKKCIEKLLMFTTRIQKLKKSQIRKKRPLVNYFLGLNGNIKIETLSQISWIKSSHLYKKDTSQRKLLKNCSKGTVKMMNGQWRNTFAIWNWWSLQWAITLMKTI